MASTVEVTSMPLPEVLVAEFRMAFTASWIASEELEFVEDAELVELVSPRSWLSDSVVEPLPRLDSSELMELVLIPLLPFTSTTHGSCSGGVVARTRFLGPRLVPYWQRKAADLQNRSALHFFIGIFEISL